MSRSIRRKLIQSSAMIPLVAVTKASTTMSRRSNSAPRGVTEVISSNTQVRIPDRNEKLLKLFAKALPVPDSSTQSKGPPPMKSYARAVNIADSQTPASIARKATKQQKEKLEDQDQHTSLP
jgi:hypothetical protein